MATSSPCPACGGHTSPWRPVRSSEPAFAGTRFELLRCESCGTAVTSGEPLGELHETGAYSAGVPRLHRVALPALRAFDAQRLALLAPVLQPGGRVLDAGAGRGRFVAAARAAGYDARGIEPSTRGALAATSAGAPVQQVSIEDADVGAASVDAVALWHVLEHLGEPRDALSRIACWLRPGGVILVGVPNLASWQARVGGERWYHFDVPRHRTHFTPAGLDILLRTSGFEPVRTTHLLLEHNPYGMWQSLVNRFTSHPSYLYNLLKRNAPVSGRDLVVTAAALPLVPVAALAELAAGIAHRGGTIAVLARRPPAPTSG